MKISVEANIIMKDLVIVGASGFAKEIAWIIDRINKIQPTWNFKGFISNDVTESKEICGNDHFLQKYSKELYVVIAIATPEIRKRLFQVYKKNPCLYFPNIIDPTAQVSKYVKMGKGNIICAGTILTVNIEIGDFNILNLNCTVGHEVTMHDYITVNPNSNISGNVTIQSQVNIGTGTQIIQGITIQKEAQIGAGAVVIKDIESSCTAVGVPAKVIKRGII